MAENEGKIEGWLYFIRCNRLGLHYSRKSYFILEENCLKSFKSKPTLRTEEPVRRAIIDSCIRIVDNGRGSHHRKVFFIFTLLNTSNHNDQLKLGATSSEEAAKWIHSLQDAAVNPAKNTMCCSKRKYQPFSLTCSKRTAKSCTEGTSTSSVYIDAMTSDVIAPSPWKIFGYRNGLRLFREAKDRDSNGRYWNGHPAVMAVGVIDGTSEAVFHTLMSLGTSRTEWDFCFYKGNVVEQLDGHTDIIHVQLYNHWLPWVMNRRDMLMRRYWRREDDGTYVILYHSVVNRKCPPQKGYVRACVKSGGYVITPIKKGKECMIKHMLAVDWKFWKSYIRKAASRSITIRMLGRIAALRELFRARAGNTSNDLFSGEKITAIGDAESRKEKNRVEVGASSLSGLNDAADEFFDVPETSDYDMTENGWPPSTSPRS